MISGIRCNIINRSTYEMESTVILKGSEDYSFINVESYGYVTSYAPRLSKVYHYIFILFLFCIKKFREIAIFEY